ncbi:MAG: DUF2087 domain-containing protein, partial [Gammaproteobacteria bacterium]|nr:DUF2087 domain-containing protein [Gammaproteobacteria bacterium]
MATREHVEGLFRRLLQSGRLEGFPRNPDHLHIVLAVATGGMARRRPYAEWEINEALADWLDSVRAAIGRRPARKA